MNERIKELLKKATRRVDREDREWVFSEVDQEKFVKLIVRECALTLESITVPVLDYNPDFDNGYNKALLTGSTVIKKHFGVEE